jgi:superfamily I DNA and/or RNA helicase
MPVIDTVDRFQGQERDVVIVSYGVSDPDYVLSIGEFILNPNRFNVSITRCKYKRIVIMSENLFKLFPEEQKLLEMALQLKNYLFQFKHSFPTTFHLENLQKDLRCTIYYSKIDN